MGGVLSAAAVAFGKPAAKQAEVVSTMLRGSIIGGMTLFFTNIISAWNCQIWAERLSKSDSFVAGDLEVAHAVECLQGLCYYDNLAWASVACVTAVVGSGASVWRSKGLARLFLFLFVVRGIHCAATMAWALSDSSSCSFWSLSKAYWLPLITTSHVTVFCALSWKFCAILGTSEAANGLGTQMTLLSENDWELDTSAELSECEDHDTGMESGARSLGRSGSPTSSWENPTRKRHVT